MKTAMKTESSNPVEMSGVGVSVETKLREEDLGETKLPVHRQLSSCAKTDERVDESSVLDPEKIELDPQ